MANAGNSDSAEIWKPIPGWEGMYEASSEGSIRSLDRPVAGLTRNGKPRPYFRRGKVLAPAKSRKGYLAVNLKHPDRPGATREIHRLVCSAFHGPPATHNLHAAHTDGDKTNNRPENLRWATPKQNQADQYRHGTRRLGEQHPMATLTDAEVILIRDMASRGVVQADIARAMGVSQRQVSKIVLRRTWRHI